MAVVLKVQIFDSPNDLAAFCAVVGNNVTTVVQIVADNNGKYLLFYT